MAKRKLQLTMKHFFIIVVALLAVKFVHAQPLTDDTVICIIDTTKSYVSYIENGIVREPPLPHHWQIAIDGHYYDHRPHDKDFACIVFEAGLWGGVKGVEGFPKKRVPKKELEKRYIVKDEEWISKQNRLHDLMIRLGVAPFDKYNYIIFSQDYYCTESDSVTMHRVEIGYSEVQY